MVRNEAVQGILTVRPIVVIQSCIFRKHLVIHLLGMCFQIIQIVYSVGCIDFVSLHECRITLHPRTDITHSILRTSGMDDYILIHRIFTTEISRVDILLQRITQTRQHKCFVENGDSGIFCQQIRQQERLRHDHAVKRMHHTIFHRIVPYNQTRTLVDVINHIIVVQGIRITRKRQIAFIHVCRRNIPVYQVRCEIGLVDNMVP